MLNQDQYMCHRSSIDGVITAYIKGFRAIMEISILFSYFAIGFTFFNDFDKSYYL